MADLGAEVIHVEPPETGDDTRRSPPFPGDVPHPEKSGLFLVLNTNKLGITLDPKLPRGREIFEELARNVDVLVDDGPPERLEEMGLGYDRLRERNPGLIIASISPFGRSGPLKNYKAYPLNISHVSGRSSPPSTREGAPARGRSSKCRSRRPSSPCSGWRPSSSPTAVRYRPGWVPETSG
jgi:crotonobetainyl-CoA:carnitine CoA-transferase CaiB-like acyl-CoA transferase